MKENKVLVDERFLDNLLNKALPKEYEVLLEGYGIDEDEETYLYLIILLLNGHVEVILDWLNSADARRVLDGAEELGLNFFDKIEYNIRLMLHDKFTDSIIPLLLSWYSFANNLAYGEMNLKPVFTDTDWLVFDALKQQNYNVLVDLSKDTCVTLRDVLYDGIKKGLNVDELTDLLLTNGLRGKGKFTSKTRAEMIARTERTRVLNQARVNAYKDNGVTWVDFITRNDGRVCNDCLELQSKNPHRLIDLENSENIPPIHPRCYDKETSVFTKRGWKLFKDVTIEDEFLSLNPETQEIEFLKPVNVILYHNTEDMVHIHNKWFDCCVTQDHDCFVSQRIDKGKKGRLYEFQFRKPNELTAESNFVRCIDYDKNGVENVNINGLNFKASDFAFFMGWYLSEGSVLHNKDTAERKKYPIKITQLKEENREILKEELTRICDYLNIKLYIGKEYFELHSKELYDYLLPLGYSHEKYITKEIYGLSRKDLTIFIDNYLLGDGNYRVKKNKYDFNSVSKTLFSSSKKLIDGLSYICLIIGYNPSFGISKRKGSLINDKKKGKIYVTNHTVHNIRLNNSKTNNYGNMVAELVPYDDMVYCVELPKYHTLWVRREGKAHWNGNCRCRIENAESPRNQIPNQQNQI